MTTRLPKFMLVLTMLAVLGLAGRVPSASAQTTTYDIGSGSNFTINTPTGQITVPIKLSNFQVPSGTGNGAKSFQVTIRLSPGLMLVGTTAAERLNSITLGPYLTLPSSLTGGCADDLNLQLFQRINNLDSTFTILATLDPGKCAQCATGAFPGGGVVFNLLLRTTWTSGTHSESVTLIPVASVPTPSPTLTDCNGSRALTVLNGNGGTVDVPLCGVSSVPAPTNFTATSVKTGLTSLGAGIAKITLSWTSSASSSATLDIWRAPFGYVNSNNQWVNAHPEYDDDNLFIAQPPTAPSGNAPIPITVLGWTKLASSHPKANPSGNPGSTVTFTDDFSDSPPAQKRGYWYYVVNIQDDICNSGLLSPRSNGALSYLLGDVKDPNNANNPGNNFVDASDVSALGSAYGGTSTPGTPGTPGIYDNLDIGPTTTRTPDGRPHPDDLIGFEDLLVVAMNYLVGPAPQFAGLPAAADHDELALDAPTDVKAGEMFTVALRMMGAGNLQGVSTQLGWDASMAEPLSVQAGPLALSQDGVVLSSGPGNVDVAVMGRDRPGLSGDGLLATVSFRATASGDPHIGVASVDARDRSNQKADLPIRSPRNPLATTFSPAAPNPFEGTSTFSFSLATAGLTELAIFSVDGRRVRTLMVGNRGVGSYHATWDGKDDAGRLVQPGLFFARLVTAEGRFGRTVVRVR